MTAKLKTTLGLDWDGTISSYPVACAILAKRFSRCVIITLNDGITLEQAVKILGCDNIVVETCPYSRTDFEEWKVEMCQKHGITLFVEDDPTIALACERAGIPILLVSPPIWRE